MDIKLINKILLSSMQPPAGTANHPSESLSAHHISSTLLSNSTSTSHSRGTYIVGYTSSYATAKTGYSTLPMDASSLLRPTGIQHHMRKYLLVITTTGIVSGSKWTTLLSKLDYHESQHVFSVLAVCVILICTSFLIVWAKKHKSWFHFTAFGIMMPATLIYRGKDYLPWRQQSIWICDQMAKGEADSPVRSWKNLNWYQCLLWNNTCKIMHNFYPGRVSVKKTSQITWLCDACPWN